MTVTFYFQDIMPPELKALIEHHTGEMPEPDFPEDETGKNWASWGAYYIGDTSDQDMEERCKEDGIEYEERFELGYFTWEDCINAVALYDANVPEEKRGGWSLEGNGPWADSEITRSDEYEQLLQKYITAAPAAQTTTA